MNKHFIIRYLLTCLILLTAGNTSAQLITKTEITKAWDTMTQFTLEVAEAMPENDYHHKLDKEAREFGEHMIHLAESNYRIATILKSEGGKVELGAKSKDEIVNELKRSLEVVKSALEKITMKEFEEKIDQSGIMKTRFHAYLFMIDHQTHTRGLSISYLSSKGISASSYNGW